MHQTSYNDKNKSNVCDFFITFISCIDDEIVNSQYYKILPHQGASQTEDSHSQHVHA